MKRVLKFSLFALIIGGYFLIDFNSLYIKFQGDGEFVVQNSECNLKDSPCNVTLEDGTTLEFEILQKDIPLMKPIDIKLTSSNKNLKNLKLKIYATNMMMGTFIKEFKNQGYGIYTTTITLPTCISGGMKWNADVQISKLTKMVGGRFQFQTK